MRVYRCPADATQTGDPFYGPGNYATNNLLLVRGAVPGPNGGYLTVRQTNKV